MEGYSRRGSILATIGISATPPACQACLVTYSRVLLVIKLIAVLGYAGGLVSAYVSASLAERKHAVHRVASPSLVVVWLSGIMLTMEQSVPITEAWIVGGLVLSLASQLALVHSVTRDQRSARSFLTAALPLAAVVYLMVFRPTWQGVAP
jgi:hypothetical protein